MIKAATLPLPTYKHQPGVNPRPTDGFLESIAEQAPANISSDNASSNEVWLYGLRLIEEGYYWEAHEILEPVWFNAKPNSRERFFIQGIIQFANATLKAEMRKPKAALRLCALCDELLTNASSQADDNLMGISVSTYRTKNASLHKTLK